MKAVITGSRHWKNRQQIYDELKLWQEQESWVAVAHGQSKGGGVDKFVEEICNELGISQQPFPVEPQDGNHRGSPLKRNERMILTFQPDIVVAFRSPGKSNGTDKCSAFAASQGIAVMTVYEEDPE